MPEDETPLAVWRFGDPLSRVENHLRDGGVVALPTESSYGLGVDPRSEAGVEAIYRLKKRERGKPLPVVIANLDQAQHLGIALDDPLLARVARHWPAPLTAIVPLSEGAPVLPAAAGQASIAVRIPAHPLLCSLLEELGHPLTATSANLSGHQPILDKAGLNRQFAGTGLLIVDGGTLVGGAPSTMVNFLSGRIEIVRLGRFDPALL